MHSDKRSQLTLKGKPAIWRAIHAENVHARSTMPLVVSLLFGNNCTRAAPPQCHAHLRAVPPAGIAAVTGIAPRRVTVIAAELVPISQCQQNPYRALTGGRGAHKTKNAITRPKAKRRHKRIRGSKHSGGA